MHYYIGNLQIEAIQCSNQITNFPVSIEMTIITIPQGAPLEQLLIHLVRCALIYLTKWTLTYVFPCFDISLNEIGGFAISRMGVYRIAGKFGGLAV